MPIAGLTGRVRALREAKLKLGYVPLGKKAPEDKDVIIGKAEDGITPEIVATYHGEHIPDAPPGTFSLGPYVRGLVPGEFDAIGADGREVWLELLNRQWGKSRIRCSGTGGGAGLDEGGRPLEGEAWCRDDALAARLRRDGLLLGPRPGGGWVARCQGPDCPLWHTHYVKGQDTLPGCHREMRFRFILLAPTEYDRTRSLDEQDDDYLRQLCWVELATGSWNGSIDVQSGLTIMQAMVGRTRRIPFTLRRVARSVSTPEGRVVKHTLMVTFDQDEITIMAASDRALLRPALRRQLAEIEAAESAAGLLPAAFADVEDIQPQQDRRALPAHRPLSDPPPLDREDALAQAASEPEPAPTPAVPPARLLDRDEIAALKVACGGTPGDRTRQGRFRELLEAAYLELGVPAQESGDIDLTCQSWRPYVPKPGRATADTPSAWATTRHREWIEARLAGEAPGEQPDLPMGGDQ